MENYKHINWKKYLLHMVKLKFITHEEALDLILEVTSQVEIYEALDNGNLVHNHIAERFQNLFPYHI